MRSVPASGGNRRLQRDDNLQNFIEKKFHNSPLQAAVFQKYIIPQSAV